MITKIVLTGGPCGGKTTAIARIRDTFTQKGYTVLSIPETATELISGGVAPWTCASPENYQRWQMQLQMEKEKAYLGAARDMHRENVLVICDRGMMDNRAYIEQEDFQEILSEMGLTVEALYARYAGVFHLETAAKGAEEFYTLSNNAARTETVSEAIALDDRIRQAWEGHAHFIVIDNTTDFEGKMKKLIREIANLLDRQ